MKRPSSPVNRFTIDVSPLAAKVKNVRKAFLILFLPALALFPSLGDELKIEVLFGEKAQNFTSTAPLRAVRDGGDGYLYGANFKIPVSGKGIFGTTNAIGPNVTTNYPFAGAFYRAVIGSTLDAGNCARIERRLPDSGYETILDLRSAMGVSAGAYAGFIEGGDGSVYGVCENANNAPNGNIFKINIASRKITILHTFKGPPSDGRAPRCAVTVTNGTVYGVTYFGGADDFGTIFDVGVDGSNYKSRFSFPAAPDIGIYPNSPLVKTTNDLWYGTAFRGGAKGGGIVFSYSAQPSNFQVLHTFGDLPNDGVNPVGEIALGTLGEIYGVCAGGGTNSGGTIYQLTGSSYEVLHSFGPADDAGQIPSGGLLLKDDVLYGGTSTFSAIIKGAAFRYKLSSKTFYSIGPFLPFSSTGLFTLFRLIMLNDGNLIGASLYGEVNVQPGGGGGIFAIRPDGSDFRFIRPFTLADVVSLEVAGPMVSDGEFVYGATKGASFPPGGSAGALFQINGDGTSFNILHTNSASGIRVISCNEILPNGDLFGSATFAAQSGLFVLRRDNDAIRSVSSPLDLPQNFTVSDTCFAGDHLLACIQSPGFGQVLDYDSKLDHTRILYTSTSTNFLARRLIPGSTGEIFVVESPMQSGGPSQVVSISLTNGIAPKITMTLPARMMSYIGKPGDGKIVGFTEIDGRTATSLFVADPASQMLETKQLSVPFVPYTDATLHSNGYFYISGFNGEQQFIGRFRLQSARDRSLEISQLVDAPGFRIKLSAQAGAMFRLQVTRDLSRQTWTTLGSMTVTTNGIGVYDDSDVQGIDLRFYRAISP